MFVPLYHLPPPLCLSGIVVDVVHSPMNIAQQRAERLQSVSSAPPPPPVFDLLPTDYSLISVQVVAARAYQTSTFPKVGTTGS